MRKTERGSMVEAKSPPRPSELIYGPALKYISSADVGRGAGG